MCRASLSHCAASFCHDSSNVGVLCRSRYVIDTPRLSKGNIQHGETALQGIHKAHDLRRAGAAMRSVGTLMPARFALDRLHDGILAEKIYTSRRSIWSCHE